MYFINNLQAFFVFILLLPDVPLMMDPENQYGSGSGLVFLIQGSKRTSDAKSMEMIKKLKINYNMVL